MIVNFNRKLYNPRQLLVCLHFYLACGVVTSNKITSLKFVYFRVYIFLLVGCDMYYLACFAFGEVYWRIWSQLPWVLNESQLGGMAVNVQLLNSNYLILRPLFTNICTIKQSLGFIIGLTILTPKHQFMLALQLYFFGTIDLDLVKTVSIVTVSTPTCQFAVQGQSRLCYENL